MNLDEQKLVDIKGGSVTLSASLLSAVGSLLNTIFVLGQSIGTSSVRVNTKKVCGIND